MKKLIFTLFTILCFQTNYAQSYTPFPDSIAVWHYCMQSIAGSYQISLLMEGDTTIQGIDYNKVYSQHSFQNEKVLFGGFRESDQKVYFWNAKQPLETAGQLVYDFGSEVGDTISATVVYADGAIPIEEIIINRQDSIFINGSYRKQWHLFIADLVDFELNPKWIEGIGFVINPQTLPIDAGGGLACFSQNNEFTYVFQHDFPLPCSIGDLCPSETVLQTSPLTPNNSCKLSFAPHPLQSSTTFTLTNCSDQLQQVVVYDLLGKKVYEEENLTKSIDFTLWRNDLQMGQYFYEVITNQGNRWTGQLVVE